MDWWTKYFASIDSLIEVGSQNISLHAFLTFVYSFYILKLFFSNPLSSLSSKTQFSK